MYGQPVIINYNDSSGFSRTVDDVGWKTVYHPHRHRLVSRWTFRQQSNCGPVADYSHVLDSDFFPFTEKLSYMRTLNVNMNRTLTTSTTVLTMFISVIYLYNDY